MDVIKNYLDNMFANLPVTEEVIKAKHALLEIMEDKYDELIKDGKNDNEAVGIVISEFGNLNELADELGINTYVKDDEKPGRFFSFDEAKEYIKDMYSAAKLQALGVFLCIICAVPPIVADWYCDTKWYEDLGDGIGAILLFMVLAFGVAFLIIGSKTISKWKFMKKENCTVDFMTIDYVKEQKETAKTNILISYVLGIGFCIMAATPAIIVDSISIFKAKYDDLSGAGVILFVGIGVALIILSSLRLGSYENILKLNNNETINEGNNDYEEVSYKNENVGRIMSIYWPTITAIYLIWSFITFDWHISWIIWPIAAIVQKIIRTMFS